MAKTRVCTCLSLLSLMVPFWSSLLSVDGHSHHIQTSGPPIDELPYVKDMAKIPAPEERPRVARLFIEASQTRRNGRTELKAYECIQQPEPVMLYCYQLSKTLHHKVYRRANFYLVSGVHKRPAWEIYRINRNGRARRFALPSQFMLGIDPKDKLVGVLENICDDFEVHKKLSEHLVLLGFLPSEMFDSFNDYYCINDLVVFQSQSLFHDYVLPRHTAYLEAVWNIVRIFKIFYDRRLAIQDSGQNRIYTWGEKKWAMLYLMEKMIDPCMLVEGDGHGTWPLQGFDDGYASDVCALFCKAVSIAAYLRSDEREYMENERWQMCTNLNGEGKCFRGNGYGRCWCQFRPLRARDRAAAWELLIWCHNHVRNK